MATVADPHDVQHRRWACEPGPFPHLARVTDLPPLMAQAAFDAVRVARTRPGSLRWELKVHDVRLELYGAGYVLPPPRPCYWSYRDVPAKIRSNHWPLAIPVRLLLVPWSDTRTTLAIELRRHPHSYAPETLYLHSAQRALDILASELGAWAFQELHELDHWLDHLYRQSDTPPAPRV